MRVFLDSSVILSACGSGKSLLRLITVIASERGLRLILASYCRAETCRNIGKLGADVNLKWRDLQTKIEWVFNALTSKKPLLLTASKDKPVLISAMAAKSDMLLTLDKGNFGLLLGITVYGMLVSTPRIVTRSFIFTPFAPHARTAGNFWRTTWSASTNSRKSRSSITS